MKQGILAVATFLTLTSLAFAATIYVPDNFSTIQEAIDASANGDIIVVRAGTYIENIDFVGKAIELRSEDGPDVTIIDGNQTASVVTFKNGEGNDSVLEGFQIMNGNGWLAWPDHYGGGVTCLNNSNPSIFSNWILNNDAKRGGGILCLSSSPLIKNNIIRENMTSPVGGDGGGIWCKDSTAFIFGNTIQLNEATNDAGGIFVGNSNLTISNNLVIDNNTEYMGGGSYVTNSTVIVSNNTFHLNTAQHWGGGFFFVYSTATITDSIIWGNDDLGGNDIYESMSTLTIEYCDVGGGWSGSGNINSDPLFADVSRDDYHLKQDPCQPGVSNPCVDAGSDLASNVGMDTLSTRTDQVPDSGIVDMGYHYDELFGPDLIVSSLTFTPDATDPNEPVTINFQVSNIGNEACGSTSTIGFYLSADVTIDQDDIKIGESYVPDLSGNSVHSASVQIVTGNIGGIWHLGGIVDINSQVDELYEFNNSYAGDELLINSLMCDSQFLSKQQGGAVTFSLLPGNNLERRHYFLLGSMSGTSPGTQLPGGNIIPLNRDSFTELILQYYNYPVFTDFRGLFNLNGEAVAVINAQGPLNVDVGTVVHFAFTTEFPYDFQSNPVVVEIIP